MSESEPEEDSWWTDESLPAIVKAARDGDLQSLRRELAAGADPYNHTGSLIHLVCERSEAHCDASLHYEAGESSAEELARVAIVEELLAAGVPPDLEDDDTNWSVTRYASYYNRPLILAALIEAAGPNAAALVRRTTNRRMDGWRPLHTASRAGHTECVRLLLSAGAGSGINDRNPMGLTALGCAIKDSRRHIYPILLAAGATFPPVDAALCPQAWTSRIDDALTHDPYLQKIRALGFPAYERTHRQALATKFAAKAFPRLPTDVAGHVVAFAFHLGYY